MFSKSAGRVALSAQSKPACAATATVAAKGRTLSSRCATASYSHHQRRQSSSKSPCSSGGPAGSEAAADNSANASTEDDKRSSGRRLQRRKVRDDLSSSEKTTMRSSNETFTNVPALPRVPATNHLHCADVHTSSFFSLHRPISVTTPIPPVDSVKSMSIFDSIFKPAPSSSTHKISDVIYTMAPEPESMDGNRSREEKDLRTEILQQSSSNGSNSTGNRRNSQSSNTIIPLDSSSRLPPLEDLVKQFRPFNVPPAPVPFDVSESVSSREQSQNQSTNDTAQDGAPIEVLGEVEGSRKIHSKPQRYPQRPSRKTYTTTLTVTETTDSSGEKKYSASASPIIERASATTYQQRSSLNGTAARQPFLAHLYERQISREEFLEDRAQAEGREMWAISVKRQRKLKMKKHKYKKLMRRTRNQRRREGRL